MRTIISCCLFVLSAMPVQAQNFMKQDISVFPKAEKGMLKYVIEVPQGTSESNAQKKIELYVGKNAEVDPCNRYFLMGELQTENLQGWGYSYYVFKTNGALGGTLMACPKSKKITKFVTATPLMMNYNGQLPVVVYVPKGYEVRYKIYQAQPEEYFGLEAREK